MKLDHILILLASILWTTHATGYKRTTVASYCPVDEIIVYETREIEECVKINAVCHASRRPCPQGWYANVVHGCWTCCRR